MNRDPYNLAFPVETDVDAADSDADSGTSDPVRAYLNEIRVAKLLTREREVEVAKRIEARHRAVFLALLKNPVGLVEFVRLAEGIADRRLRVHDFLSDIDKGDPEFDEDSHARRLMALFASVERGLARNAEARR